MTESEYKEGSNYKEKTKTQQKYLRKKWKIHLGEVKKYNTKNRRNNKKNKGNNMGNKKSKRKRGKKRGGNTKGNNNNNLTTRGGDFDDDEDVFESLCVNPFTESNGGKKKRKRKGRGASGFS